MGKSLVNVNKIAKEAAKEAIKEYKQEQLKEKRKQVFQNTRILLKNYNDLKDHVNNAISDEYELYHKEDIETIIDDYEIYVQSIKKSKRKTLIMIAHIDKALERLRVKMDNIGQPEKYQSVKLFYIDGIEFENILKELNCSSATLRRWMNTAINELSIGIFGVDGINLDVM